MGRGKKSSVFDFYKHAGPLGLGIECRIIEELFVPSGLAVVVADHRFAFRGQLQDAQVRRSRSLLSAPIFVIASQLCL
jgi:hypothetical protein